MKKFYVILMLSLFAFSACTIEDDSQDEIKEDIKDQIAQGMIDSDVDFLHTSALYKEEVSFDEKGYMFYLDDEQITCSKQMITPVSFFVKSSGALKIGKYKGSGPYIYYNGSTSSFFGCDVEITKVTDTTIEGKVKGGNDEKYIEGTFSATICKK